VVSEEKKIRIAVLASGSGTNLEAIARAAESGEIPVEISLVLSDNPQAYALVRAEKHNIPTKCFLISDFPSREAFDKAIADELSAAGVELVVLAGYMKLVGGEILSRFKNRIMNIHPALLPSFPGTHGVRDALEYGVKVSGVTVHFVDEGLDTGPIILQEAVPVYDGDDEETLHQRIHQVEYRLYPLAIKLFAQGRLKVEGGRVRIIPAEDE